MAEQGRGGAVAVRPAAVWSGRCFPVTGGITHRPPVQDSRRRLALSDEPGVIGRCRDFTREALADWRWVPPDGAGPAVDEAARRALVQDVLLLVSEVVTNACMYTDGPLELVLDLDDERLRIEVLDPSPVPPRPRYPSPDLPGGHGLHVVEKLSRAWGADLRSSGKTVWLEVTRPGANRDADAGRIG